MNDDYYKHIFSKNLTYYMNLYGKTQADIINALGVNKSAISTWCNGTRLPRMDKVDALAKYFNILRSELIDEDGPKKRLKRENEERLLTSYNQLNTTGKEKVIEYASDLSHNPRYIAVTTLHETPEYNLNAAHEDGATPEQKTAADDIMMDDSEWE